MDEKLIIELDDNKIKYGVFGINENNQYQLLSKKISENAGIKRGKVLDFEYSTKVISKDLDEIEKEVNKVFKSISVVLNQKDVFCTNLCGFKKLNGSKAKIKRAPRKKENIAFKIIYRTFQIIGSVLF